MVVLLLLLLYVRLDSLNAAFAMVGFVVLMDVTEDNDDDDDGKEERRRDEDDDG